MIPDRRGNASDVQFVLFEVAGITVLAASMELRFQFLKASDRVRSEPFQIQLAQYLGSLVHWHVGQHDLAHGGAVKRDPGADAGVNAQLLRRIEFLDVHSGQSVPHGQMDSLTRLLVQLLKVGKTEPADVELAQCGLTDREACDSEMVYPVASAVQESGTVQLGQKAV